MKTHLYCLTCLFFLPLLSCQKEDELDFAKQIQGVWNWEKSVGGIGGWTLTPKTENYSKTLYISSNTIKEYKDDKLQFSTTYELKINTDSTAWKCCYYLEFPNGIPNQSIWIEDQQLMFFDWVSDGFGHSYRRKLN